MSTKNVDIADDDVTCFGFVLRYTYENLRVRSSTRRFLVVALRFLLAHRSSSIDPILISPEWGEIFEKIDMPASRVGVMPQPNQMPQRNVNRKGGGGTAGRQNGITMEVRRLVSFVFLSFIVEKAGSDDAGRRAKS